jgi:hypothetical protein
LTHVKGNRPARVHDYPTLRTSPILENVDEDFTLDAEIETGVCYFNDVPYPVGEYVLSGDELLHCEDRGVWVCKGEIEP